MDGCDRPRQTFPSGRIVQKCREHETERVRLLRRRPVLDPDTGQTVSLGNLINRRSLRRKAERAAETGR